MLRLFMLAVSMVGLASLLPATPNASALPADQSDSDCLGLLRSALVRSGSTVAARDPETGETTDNSDAGCRLTCDDFGGKDRCSDSDRDGWLNYVEEMWGSAPDDASSTPENLGECIDFDNGPICQPF